MPTIDTKPYPRKTVAAILAVLAGSVAGGIVAGIVATGPISTTSTSDNAIYAQNGGIAASSTRTGGVNASKVDLVKIATSTIDAQALSAWSASSVEVAFTGAKIQDSVSCVSPFVASDTQVTVKCQVDVVDFVRFDFVRVSSTPATFDPPSAIFPIRLTSPSTN